MLRTFIQLTALCLTLISAFFLIRAPFFLSTKDIVSLSSTTYDGFNVDVLRNLAKQQANTRVGFCILLLSFIFQTVNLLWPIIYLDINRNGVIISIIVSILFLILGLYVVKILKNKTLKELAMYNIKWEEL